VRKKIPQRFFVFAGIVFLSLTLSFSLLRPFQSFLISTLTFFSGGRHRSITPLEKKVQQLEVDLALYKERERVIKDLFNQEIALFKESLSFNSLTREEMENLDQRLLERHDLFTKKLQSITAPVIYRAPFSWNSSLWVGVGEKDNPPGQKPIIAKNSPVLLGNALVGIVERVGHSKSEVRLITDSKLHPSVRAKRIIDGKVHFLAKGALKGASEAAWRSKGSHLIGEGFNYDFEDDEGSPRDLRDKKSPLLQKEDLLVTTGMDGAFPPGLDVGRVVKVCPLKESDYCYEIEVEPAVKHLNDLSLVVILPPIGD